MAGQVASEVLMLASLSRVLCCVLEGTQYNSLCSTTTVYAAPQSSEFVLLCLTDRYCMHTGRHLEYIAANNDEYDAKYGFHNALYGW